MTPMSFPERLQRAWNAFLNKDPTFGRAPMGMSSSARPDRVRLTRGNERSIINAVFNRISLDVAACDIKHVRLDENNRYLEEINSGLNNCLGLEANIDQTGRAFLQDAVLNMLDKGHVVLSPIDMDDEPSYDSPADNEDIISMRVCTVQEWRPREVLLDAYNDRIGRHQEFVMPKSSVAIVTNPFYTVMNESNSTLQRLIRKLNILDVIDEQSGAGKLDLIIQLPYVIKTDARREQANKRRKDIEEQLASSKYGIAYTDGTEHVTQLNRSVDNNLMTQIEYLMRMLFSQLGITEEILNGTANDSTMNNYYSRVVEPILNAFVEEMRRKFLTKTARTQRQSIMFFRDPFKLVPTTQLAELADKFTRNEITTSNEFRQIVGMKPSKDPHADELRNKNLSVASDAQRMDINGNPIEDSSSEVNLEELLDSKE